MSNHVQFRMPPALQKAVEKHTAKTKQTAGELAIEALGNLLGIEAAPRAAHRPAKKASQSR